MQNDLEPVPPPASERWSMGCAAVIFGLLAFWIGWIVANFLDGHGWFDFVVGLVVYEVILAVGLLSLALFIGALFAPTKTDWMIEFVGIHAAKAAAIFFAVLIAPWVLFAVIWGVLSAFGVVR